MWTKRGTDEETQIDFRVCNIMMTESAQTINEETAHFLQSRGAECAKTLFPKLNRSFWVGLGAPDLVKMREEIGGRYYVSTEKDKDVEVHLINAFGTMFPNDLDDNDLHIVISDQVAHSLNLLVGDILTLKRKIDETGRLRLMTKSGDIPVEKIWKPNLSLGGMKWGYKHGQIMAMVVHIEGEEEEEDYCVGVSAMFMDNLDLTWGDTLFVESETGAKECQFFNAGGMHSVPGCGIRMSKKLADDLDVKAGDMICLSKNKDGCKEKLEQTYDAKVKVVKI